MHPYALIPLLALIAAGVLASAVAAREPDRRANRLVGLALACGGVWSLFELLFATAPDAESATRYLRWSTLGSLPIGPLILQLVITLREGRLAGLKRVLPFSYATSALFLVLAVSTDLLARTAVPTAWGGWMAVPGSLLPISYFAVGGFPVIGVVAVLLSNRGQPDEDPIINVVTVSGALFFCVATLTEFVLPQNGLPCPRLGGATLVLWGGIIWWQVYRFREPRLSPQRFAREILDTLPDGIAFLRLDGRIRTTNRRLSELTGLTTDELVGRPIEKLLDVVENAEGAGERMAELVTTAGSRIPVSVLDLAVTDREGEPLGHVMVVRDEREVVSLRSRLVSAGRLVAVGQLAAGIAHEINNPIAYVRSNLRQLESHWETLRPLVEKGACPPPVQEALGEGPELLEETGDGIDRVAAIVRDVGGFSRGGIVERELADLSELLDTAARIAAPQLKRMTVERRYSELPPVYCVPQELMQVFLNLLLNASQSFCGSNGTIRLATRTEDGGAVVEVADDGSGIDPELLERIFEPFFTTKPVGRGTGLGLSISHQILRKHGGTIQVDSAPGEGTTFRIHLPAFRVGEETG